jgi:hypothetical protein
VDLFRDGSRIGGRFCGDQLVFGRIPQGDRFHTERISPWTCVIWTGHGCNSAMPVGVDQCAFRPLRDWIRLQQNQRTRGNKEQQCRIQFRGVAMSKTITTLMAAALIAVAVPSFASVASAAPADGALAIKNAATSNIETVRWVGRSWGWGRGWGWGLGGGLAAGAIIGGALSAPYYYGGYYGGPYYAAPYYASPYYAAPEYEVEPGYYAESYGGGGGGGVDYCMRRYRSYDRRTGTFLGNDGRRHPCP